MVFAGLRTFVFDPLSGLSLLSDDPSEASPGNGDMEYHQSCTLAVNLPIEKNLSDQHPGLIEQLEIDWGIKLSSMECSTGDFRRALHEGTPLGHVWAEIFSLIVNELAKKLRFAQIGFREEVVRIVKGDDDDEGKRVLYQVSFGWKAELPERVQPLVGQVVYLVSGYLNACYDGEEFDIHKAIREIVRHRLSRPRRNRRARKRTGQRELTTTNRGR